MRISLVYSHFYSKQLLRIHVKFLDYDTCVREIVAEQELNPQQGDRASHFGGKDTSVLPIL